MPGSASSSCETPAVTTQETEPQWKSLESVRREVDIEQQRQDAIVESLDTRAGIMLGFAGVIVAVGGAQGTLGLYGAALAGVSAVLSAVAMVPRTHSVMDTQKYAQLYLYEEPGDPDREALKRRLKNLKDNDDARRWKVLTLKPAIVTLIASVVLTAIGVAGQKIDHPTKESGDVEQSQSAAAG